MFRSERNKRGYRSVAVDTTTSTNRRVLSGKMSLCRACLVLLNTEDPSYDLCQENDLADKFFGCLGAGEDQRFRKASLVEEKSPQIVLKSICECCYQLVQKFYDFQRMCEESFRNFEKLILEVNPNVTLLQTPIQDDKQVQPKELLIPESIEEIEEVYIIEDEHAKQTLGKEKIAVSAAQRSISKRPRGLRYKIDCPICSRGFYKMSLFEAHMQKHRGEQPYKCTVGKCNKIYSRADLLSTHLREAHQNKGVTYQCEEPNCNKVYTALRSLNYHIKRQHTKEVEDSKKPRHMCEKCGKSYGRKAHLTRHLWVHKSQAERKFACSYCMQRFYTNQNLNDHIRRRHCKKHILRCKRCGRNFRSRSVLTDHMKKHVKSRKISECSRPM